MGLDSVALLMEFENNFGVRISDVEAGKISTINDMVETISRIKNINKINFDLREKILNQIIELLKEIRNEEIKPSDKISDYLNPSFVESWKSFHIKLGFEFSNPKIYDFESNKLTNRIRNIINWMPRYDWNNMNLEDFAESLCKKNYKNLLDFNNITSKYEIYIGVAGITSEKMDISCYEISSEKSFTKDLGID